MARFKFLGLQLQPGQVVHGPVTGFVFHHKDGVKRPHNHPNPKRGFLPGDELGVDITDERVIRHLRVDPRFAEIK